MNEPVCDVPSDLKAVPRSRENLLRTCEALHEQLGVLEKALGSVMRSVDESDAKSVSQGAECDLAAAIDAIDQRVGQACSRVCGIIGRLEL